MLESTYSHKVCIPYQPPTILHRQSLLAVLNAALTPTESSQDHMLPASRIVLFCAPSGYGKTTILVDFVQQAAVPCCWYELDSGDNDTLTFLSYFISSVQRCFPSFARGLQQYLQERVYDDLNISNIVDEILQTMQQDISERFIFVLSNFHEVNENAEILSLVNKMIQRLPPTCLLIVESRSAPDLDLAPFLHHQEVLVIGKERLRFSAQEITELARLRGGFSLTTDEAEYLARTFDGWIAGILLGTRLSSYEVLLTHLNEQSVNTQSASAQSVDAQLVNTQSGNKQAGNKQEQAGSTGQQVVAQGASPLLEGWDQRLFEYLIDEVFKSETEAYAFLREAAILRQMTPSLCDALLERQDSAHLLQYLERQDLFVSHTRCSQSPAYVCHAVLRDVLCRILEERDPDRFYELHMRAARLYRAERDYKAAYYHASQVHAFAYIVTLIIDAATPALQCGSVETIEYWLLSLPQNLLLANVRLLLILSNIYLMQGKAAAATPLLEKAEQGLDQQGLHDAVSQLQRTEIALARSKLAFFDGHYEEAQTLCQQTLEEIPADEISLRAEAYLRLGMCAQTLGNFADCIRALQQALRLLGYTIESYQTARLHSLLANTYSCLGNLPLAEHHRARAIACLENLHDERGKATNLIGMGVTLQRYGSYDESERVLTQALEMSRGPLKFQRGEGYALVSLGDIYLEQDKYDQALQVLEDGLRVAYQLGDHYLIHYTQSTLAMTYLLMDDPHTALLLVSHQKELNTSKTHFTYGEILNEMARGAVNLQQGMYQETLDGLTRLQSDLAADGYKRERLQTAIRLLASYSLLQKEQQAQKLCHEIVQLALQEHYEVLARVEISHMRQLLDGDRYTSALATLFSQVLRAVDSCDAKSRCESAAIPPDAIDQVGKTTPSPVACSSDADADIDHPARTEVPASPALHASTVTQETTDPVPAARTVVTVTPHRRSITVLALGEPSILIDDVPVTRWRVSRVMELCFYLLDCTKPSHKEQIMLDLWPDTESSTDQSLRSIVYYLRKTLGERCISYHSGYYKLELDQVYGEAVQYDVAQFEQLYEEARQADTRNEAEHAYDAFSRMVALYRGDYVQSFYRDWCIQRRDMLRQFYIDARRHLATISWQREDYQDCVLHWQHVLATDNCNEDAHYGLMCAYMKIGQRNLALRQYRRCVSALHEDLNIEPRQNIQQLYHRLMHRSTNTLKL